MLGRFICPASRLKELRMLSDRSPSADLEVAVLGRGGNDKREFLLNLKLDLEDILHLNQNLVVSHGYEVKLPATLSGFQRVHGIGSRPDSEPDGRCCPRARTGQADPFFECPWSEARRVVVSLKPCMRAVIGGLAGNFGAGVFDCSISHVCTSSQGSRRVLRGANIPWKATAGLPIRYVTSTAGCKSLCTASSTSLGAGILDMPKKLKGHS